jgi:xylose isomerase
MTQFKFSAGPWNISEGADNFGPPVRKTFKFIEKVKILKKLGIEAVQFHDDDVVPDINNKTHSQKLKAAREVKNILNDYGLVAEFVAPRFWEDPHTIDGALTSNSQSDREYCYNRALTTVDIANEIDCKLIGFWFAREGTVCQESKSPVEGWKRLVEGLNKLLEHDRNIRIFIEPKPNEPIDRSFCPTMGHAMALSMQTVDPPRVGGLVESAHAVLAGLDPANEMACALAYGKLFGVHLNDQNGMKFDQDKTFGSENLRQSFNQIKLLVEYDFGKNGEFIGLDVQAMRTQKEESSWRHLENSIKIVKILEQKVKNYDYAKASEYIQNRDYEALEMYVVEYLLNA